MEFDAEKIIKGSFSQFLFTKVDRTKRKNRESSSKVTAFCPEYCSGLISDDPVTSIRRLPQKVLGLRYNVENFLVVRKCSLSGHVTISQSAAQSVFHKVIGTSSSSGASYRQPSVI